MKFHGVVHVWRFLSARQQTPIGNNKIKVQVIQGRGPFAFYDPRYGYECFTLTIMMSKNADFDIQTGHLLEINGKIKSFNSKFKEPGEQWVTMLECDLSNVKIIGMKPFEMDPIEHLKSTGTNAKGI